MIRSRKQARHCGFAQLGSALDCPIRMVSGPAMDPLSTNKSPVHKGLPKSKFRMGEHPELHSARRDAPLYRNWVPPPQVKRAPLEMLNLIAPRQINRSNDAASTNLSCSHRVLRAIQLAGLQVRLIAALSV